VRLDFITLRMANMARQKVWDPGSDITLEYRGNELAGEVGEAVENVVDLLQLSISTGRMANVVKKLARERLGLRGSRATVEDLGKELADIVICVDLLAMHAGIDLGNTVRDKFNETSEKVGLPTRLP
jgi:NTP pyrophosphatase (non-canonical NTP hydrolase)